MMKTATTQDIDLSSFIRYSMLFFLSSIFIGLGIVKFGLPVLYLFVGLVTFLIIFFNPYAGICLLSFFIPIEQFIKGSTLFSGMKLLGILVLFALILRTALKKELITVLKKKHIYQPVLLYMFFIIWNILSVTWAKDQAVCYVKLQTQISLFIYFVMLILIATYYKKTSFINYFILGSVVSVVSLFSQVGTADFSQFDRLSGGGLDKNEFAVIICISLCISQMIFKTSSRASYRIFLLLYSPIAIFSITYTKSRTGLLCLLIFAIHYFITTRSNRKLYKFLRICFFLLICWAVISFAPTGFFDRVTDFRLGYDSNLGRLDLWQAAFQIFLENPVLGVGVNNFKYYGTGFFKTISEPTVAHNAFISVTAELGVIGLILYCALIFYYLNLLTKNLIYFNKLYLHTNNKMYINIFYGLFFAFGCYLLGSLALTWEYVKILPFLLGSATVFHNKFHPDSLSLNYRRQ